MATDALTIASNATGLFIAEEESPGVLAATPVWREQEPNEYGEFGGEIKTVARRPINPSRQRSKGVTTDLDAGAEFTADLTQENAQVILQGFLYADLRTKDEIDIPAVDGTANGYSPASGGDEYEAGDLLFAKGDSDEANLGLKVVTGIPTATTVLVTDTGLVTDAAADVIISRVGFQFANDAVSIDVSGALPKLTISNTSASSTLTITSTNNALDTETVTIGGKVYTFQTVLTNVDGHVLIGADKAASLANLAHAINLSGGVAGTDYALATTVNPYVTASVASPMVATAKVAGAKGNTIGTTETLTNGSWTSTVLAGGAGRDLTTLGLIPGEPVFLGGDVDDNKFDDSSGINNGWKRVRSVVAGAITFDKSEGTMVAETTGDSRNVRIFFGRVLKNESDPDLQVARTYQAERQLGAPDIDAPTLVQAEYVINQSPDEVEINLDTADKAEMTYTFTGGTTEYNTAAEGVKTGTRLAVEESDAFNTSSDLGTFSLARVVTGDEAPDPLLVSIEKIKINIKNNHAYNKKLGYLGSFSASPGLFEASVEGTAYFVDVEAQLAVIDNDDCTMAGQFAKHNQGIAFDMPLGAVGGGKLDVKADEAVRAPFTFEAARGRGVHTTLDHTFLFAWFDYLPDAAEPA